MNESEFLRASSTTLDQIARAIDSSGLDIECGFKGDGVLEIETDQGTKVIVNRQTAAREVWVAGARGGFHFRDNAGIWRDTRDGASLQERLSELLGAPIEF